LILGGEDARSGWVRAYNPTCSACPPEAIAAAGRLRWITEHRCRPEDRPVQQAGHL